MVSHAVGARFLSLIGGAMLSFYDWYADLPVASPQMFGDQTDVPESGDWWDASYLMMWGSNVPVTRTPDAHWMAEARYRGPEGRRGRRRTTPTTSSSPTSGCPRSRAPTARWRWRWATSSSGSSSSTGPRRGSSTTSRATPTCRSWSRWSRSTAAATVPGKFLTAADLGETDAEAAFRPVLWDAATDAPAVPNGSLGHRFTEAGRRPVEPRPRRDRARG